MWNNVRQLIFFFSFIVVTNYEPPRFSNNTNDKNCLEKDQILIQSLFLGFNEINLISFFYIKNCII